MARLNCALRTLPSVLLLFAGFGLTSPAWANGIVVPQVSLQVGVEGGTPGVDLMNITNAMIQAQIDAETATAVENVDGSVTVTGLSFSMASWGLDLQTITLDPDPFVSFVGAFTNFAGVAMDFIFSTVLPVVPVLPSSLIGGSTTVTYGDANFDGLGGLTNSTLGGAAYSGTVDGSNALNMLAVLGLAPAFAGDTQFANQTLGLPGPTIPYGPALVSIGITQRFNLSTMDQATFNSTFRVEPVPEPTTGLLLGFGLLAMGALRRRAH